VNYAMWQAKTLMKRVTGLIFLSTLFFLFFFRVFDWGGKGIALAIGSLI